MIHQPITADWTRDTRAQRVLATFATNPPRVATIANQHRWSRADRTFVGYRAEVLERIWAEHGDALLKECDATGDYAAFDSFNSQPSVDDAIMASLEPAAAADAIHFVARRAA